MKTCLFYSDNNFIPDRVSLNFHQNNEIKFDVYNYEITLKGKFYKIEIDQFQNIYKNVFIFLQLDNIPFLSDIQNSNLKTPPENNLIFNKNQECLNNGNISTKCNNQKSQFQKMTDEVKLNNIKKFFINYFKFSGK